MELQRQRGAARTLGAHVVRALMAFGAPAGSAAVAPLFVKPRRGLAPLGVPGLTRPAAPAESEETWKRREPGSRDFPPLTRRGRVASIPMPAQGSVPAAPGAPPGAPACSVGAQGLQGDPPNSPKVFFFFFFLIFVFSGCFQKAHGLGEVRGAGKRKR